MSNSLRDQLLKQGLVSKDQVQKAEADKRKHRKQAKKKQPQAAQQMTEAERTRKLAAKRQAEKIARDRQLNLKREQERQAQARKAQLKELIESNQVAREPGEVSYNFTHGKRIKRLYLSANQHKQLVAGKLAITCFKGTYYLVAPEVAERLRKADESLFLHRNPPPSEADDDPYADYPVPDDLMW
ncbi:hypothetical protein CAI21_02535 [Alkalilimnicola ehrlichii]|uniref:Nucleoprotein/polynucleotide-associated enzyme n=1 Tax=Alkalilimnicola ehrlichii TaxID=351052 RepID=A0A3E0X1Y2_9GAMM|nr:DUF2058 domain-containing protein [Alkalilimnicola ehrlichii]RFA30878.1 hypothetical protein CAI21_02535 [Alkalilimnicola ehrlichii]RFA38829.1 hypothetical protein CAL65_02685 [Alkalilimnicola ehrlichii]